MSTVAFAIGAVGVAAGVYFVVRSGSGASATTTAVAPRALPGGGGLSLERTF